jgi:hypothetical protein
MHLDTIERESLQQQQKQKQKYKIVWEEANNEKVIDPLKVVSSLNHVQH